MIKGEREGRKERERENKNKKEEDNANDKGWALKVNENV